MCDLADGIVMGISNANHINIRKNLEPSQLKKNIQDRNTELGRVYRMTYQLEELMEVAVGVNRSIVSNKENSHKFENWIRQLTKLRSLLKGMVVKQ